MQQENAIAQEVDNIRVKLEFALFKLQTKLEGICSGDTSEENFERCRIILTKYENFLSNLEDDVRSQISDHAVGKLSAELLSKSKGLKESER